MTDMPERIWLYLDHNDKYGLVSTDLRPDIDTEYIRIDKYEELETKIDKQEEVLNRIHNWCKAYPLTVFPKPDYTICRIALKEADQTVDAISADCQRHLLETISKIIGELND